MLNNLDRDQHKALPRQRQIQSSASRKECALRLQKPPHHSHCWSHPVGQWRNEHLKNVDEIAFVPDKLPISTSGPVEKQLSPLSTRCSNSKGPHSRLSSTQNCVAASTFG